MMEDKFKKCKNCEKSFRILEGWKHGCDAVTANRIKSKDDCLLHGMSFFIPKEADTGEIASVQGAVVEKKETANGSE